MSQNPLCVLRLSLELLDSLRSHLSSGLWVYRTGLLVVHHTKKGTRYETMHNDNMRGSSVFGGGTDTVLMFRCSAVDDSKRLLKPTKLRHGSDEMRKARLLELNPGILWFMDIGEADEMQHIAKQDPTSGRKTAEQKIDWSTVFGGETDLKRKEVVERLGKNGISKRNADRLLKKASEEDRLKPKLGQYTLIAEKSLPLPVAA